MGVGTCLVEAAPSVKGERLQLKFGPDHEFHRQQLSNAKILQWLSGLTSGCFGRFHREKRFFAVSFPGAFLFERKGPPKPDALSIKPRGHLLAFKSLR